MSIRVVIADDHPVVRDGLRLAIEKSGKDIEVAGEASDGMEALVLARTIRAEVFIIDITMPNLNGIDTMRELLKWSAAAKVIMLSFHDRKAMVDESLEAGARGYLTKETATRNIVDAVTEVHEGRYYLSPGVAHFVIQGGAFGKKAVRNRGSFLGALSGQESKVLQLIAEGNTNKEIASMLSLSTNTVHVHRNNLMAKLNIHNQARLVRYAIKAGIAKL